MSYRFAVITDREIAIRPATTDADLEAWNDVRRIVMPNESAATIELLRAEESPDRLMLLAESGGQVVGSGVADRSHITGGFVAPRVLPDHRRHGVGSALLRVLLDHLIDRGFRVGRRRTSRTSLPRLRASTTASRRSTARSSRSAR